MKHPFEFLPLVLIVVLTAGCSNESKLNSDACVQFDREPFDFDRAVESVDLLAHVKISELHSVIHEHGVNAPVFEVEILEVIKGESGQETITVFQDKECEFDLFEEGEEWILFLNEYVDFPEAEYWIEGSKDGVFRIDDAVIEEIR
ncbi:hypothetical protein [Alkalicoccobacillus murimartini]|uniref:Lipoprotein n=1 Tax=Alkalicoccobacillus murimartini TaxID=171685 RepID=A0ABT9YIE5_9BACI|nr:hypothetical protein [Alkalicoccobacillus murimartini]MDQ0207476.1 hypothetical protein [Alkalicoccobacillus murimartini]